MISLPRFRFSFTFSWKMLLLTLIGMALFIRLGFWQVHRALEKRLLLKASQSQQQHAPRNLVAIQNPLPYQSVLIQGEFLSMTLLLDNQHHAHQFGYDIITPLVLKNGKVVLVDRGWVGGDAKRLSFPVIKTPVSEQTIEGYVYFPSAKQWLLGPNIDQKNNNLSIIETIDISGLSQFLHKSLYPFIIRQSVNAKNEYIRDWPIVATAPERHDAYALQWFIFAIIVGIIYLALSIKKRA